MPSGEKLIFLAISSITGSFCLYKASFLDSVLSFFSFLEGLVEELDG